MDAKKQVSRPNTTEQKKKMEVINPRQANPVQKGKTIPAKKLERVSSSSSPSTTLTDFSFGKTISASEKQQLELLTSDPLSFTAPSSLQSTDRSKTLQFLQETLELMQKNKEEIENEEAYERMVDTLKYSEAGERFEKMQKMQKLIESLRNQKDDLGNNLVEFPEDFDEMVETAVEYKKNHNFDDVNWVEVFQSKHEHEAKDEKYKKKRDKIRELDRVLKQKEKYLKDLRSSRESDKSSRTETPSGSVFITKVKTKNEVRTVRPTANFVKKNIENIEEYKGGSYLTEKLTDRDQYRLALIEENLDTIEEYNGILPQDSALRLEEIDRTLRNYVPQLKWEEMSVSSGQYSNSSKKNPKIQKAKPGDPVLREAQERRETISELQDINSKLLELQNRPVRPLDDQELQNLLIDTGYDFDSLPAPISYKSSEETLLDEAKESIRKIEELEKLDFDEVLEIVLEAETALLKYQKIAEIQDRDLENDLEFVKAKSSLRETLDKCEGHQKECDTALDRIEKLEEKLKKQREELEKEEKIEEAILEEAKVPEVKPQSLEEIDQEIESKTEFPLKTGAFFPDMDEITPENYPTLYYVYEKVLQQEGSELV